LTRPGKSFTLDIAPKIFPVNHFTALNVPEDPHLRKTFFEFPIGLRPWDKELRRRGHDIKDGYSFAQLDCSSDSYRFSAMLGASKVADVFSDFARSCLSEEAFFILEFYQEEWGKGQSEPPPPAIYYSPYLGIDDLLETLQPFWPRLVHDGFVGFGLANNRLGMEMFYSEEKTLTCFTGNHIRIMDLFARHRLPHRHELLLPTDFGHDHLSLQCQKQLQLPAALAKLSQEELDYMFFCPQLTDLLDMYPVEESLSFFLSRKEQDQIEALLRVHPDFSDLAEEDFGALILDWNDFVEECETRFDGDLWEYQQGLKLRDLIQFVVEGVPTALGGKLEEILADPDQRFQQALSDQRKRLDPPADLPLKGERFWYHGVTRNQGAPLRRDLIRHGWYHP
jgi:hypothetical protein